MSPVEIGDCCLRQSEDHVSGALGVLPIFLIAGAHRGVLLAVDHERRRRCIACVGKFVLPQQLARLAVAGAHLAIVDGCADDDQIARGHDRTTRHFMCYENRRFPLLRSKPAATVLRTSLAVKIKIAMRSQEENGPVL
jgi:hypothetical protein